MVERRRQRQADDSAAHRLRPNGGEGAGESEHAPITPEDIAEADQLHDLAGVGLVRDDAADTGVPISDWLTPEQAAAYLQIAPSSLARLCHTGAVRYYTVWFSRTRRFRIEDLDKVMVRRG